MNPRTRLTRVVLAVAVASGVLATGTGCVTRVPDPSASPWTLVSPAPQPSPNSPGPSGTGSASPTTAPPAPSVAVPPPPRVPTSGQLRQALLTPGDLAGFVTGHDDSGGAGTSGCPALDSDFSSGSSASAEALLTKAAAGVSIRERLRQFSEAGAKAVVSRIRGAAGSCAKFTGTDPKLGRMTFTVTRLSQPAHGDDSTALRITVKPDAYDVMIFENLVAVRHGGTLLVITHVAPTTIDNGLTAAATATAYRKLTPLW
jgi:hypothetical protein